MRNKFFIALIAIFVVNISFLYAQDDNLDSLDFEYQEADEFEEANTTYFTFGGGFVLNMLKLNFDDLNKHLLDNKFINSNDKLDGYLYQLGGQGFISIGVIPNIRLGFLSVGGSKTPWEKGKLDTTTSPIVTKYLDYHTSFTGLTIDYAILPIKNFRFVVLPGVAIGRGSIKIETYRSEGEIDWNDYKFENRNNDYYSSLESGFWYFTPNVNFEYSPTDFSLFRLSIGYSLSMMGDISINNDWKMNNQTEIINMPSGINSNGLNIQFGIFLGLFNF